MLDQKKTVIFPLVALLLLPLCTAAIADGGGADVQGALGPEQLEEILMLALERYREGKASESIQILAEAIMRMRNELSLGLSKLTMCSEVRGYNDYDAKDGFVLESGEPLLLYIEPEGYGVRKEGDEYRIWISQDVEIKDESGEVIFQRSNWVDYNKAFPTPIIPFYLTNRVRDIPAGRYVYTLTLKDHHKNAFLTESFEFVVR